MTKIRLFSNEHQWDLEEEVNKFMQGKTITSVSYTTNTVGYSVHHYCCVTYVAW